MRKTATRRNLGIKIIMGRARTGKSAQIREYIKEDIKNGKKAVLLVPEQYTLQSEQDFIRNIDSNGIIDLSVLSFTSFSDILRSRYRGKNRSLIDDTGIYILTSRATEESREELEVFKQSYRKKGFLEETSRVIQSFKKNCINPEDIDNFLGAEEGSGILKKKLKDVNIIYKKMNEYMKNEYMDHNDMMVLLSQNIEETDWLKGKNVYIDGFDVFSGREYEVIESIAKSADSVTVALNFMDDKFQRDFSLFTPVDITYRKLDSMSMELFGEYAKVERKNKNYIENRYLKHLEKNLYAYPSESVPGEPDTVSINSYLNPNEEVEGIAVEMIKLVMERKARWRDILVVSNDMESYQTAVKRVFSEYGIPFFLDEKRDISSHNLMVYVIDLLNAIDRGFRYQDVFKFLKTDLSVLSSEEVDILENYSLQYNIEGEKYFRSFELREGDPEEAEEIRAEFAEEITPLKEALKGKASIREINEKLYRYLRDTGVKEKTDSLMEEQLEAGNIDIANETAQIWNILMDIFDQMTEIMGDLEVSISEYVNIMESGLANYKAGIIPPTLDQVIFGSLDRTKSGDIKYLFVIGVNDGVLPQNMEDAGILLDEDRERMKENGLDMNMDVNMMIESENFKIYSSFTKPEEKLYISFPMSSQTGASLRPSTIIDRLKHLFPDIKIISHMDISENMRLGKIVSKRPSIKYLSESFRDYIDGIDIDDEWYNIYSWHMNNEKDKDYEGNRVKNIIEGLFLVNQQEYIEEKYARRVYSMPMKASVSRIEKFNSCPFSHFMTYGISPRERKKCVVEYPDIGNILHETLERYGKNLKLENRKWTDVKDEEMDRIIDGIIDESLEESGKYIFKASARYRYLVNKLKRVSRRSIRKATRQIEAGEFTPVEYELAFRDRIPALEFRFEDGTVLELEGVIDRLDICRDEDKTYFRVIDYKSGNQDFDISKALQGLQIQLIVYLDAIISGGKTMFEFKETELYPAGAFYFKLKDPIAQGESLEEAEEKRRKGEKISGIMVNDRRIAELMDMELKENSDESSLYNIKINKNKTMRKRSDILAPEDIALMINYVEEIIKESGTEIKKGNVKIEPYMDESGKETPCSYCEYSSICKFDISLDGNEYRKLKKMDIDSIKEKDGESDA